MVNYTSNKLCALFCKHLNLDNTFLIFYLTECDKVENVTFLSEFSVASLPSYVELKHFPLNVNKKVKVCRSDVS